MEPDAVLVLERWHKGSKTVLSRVSL